MKVTKPGIVERDYTDLYPNPRKGISQEVVQVAQSIAEEFDNVRWYTGHAYRNEAKCIINNRWFLIVWNSEYMDAPGVQLRRFTSDGQSEVQHYYPGYAEKAVEEIPDIIRGNLEPSDGYDGETLYKRS